MSLTEEEVEGLRCHWRYVFELQEYVSAHPDDIEARSMFKTFVDWLTREPSWCRLLVELGVTKAVLSVH